MQHSYFSPLFWICKEASDMAIAFSYTYTLHNSSNSVSERNHEIEGGKCQSTHSLKIVFGLSTNTDTNMTLVHNDDEDI
jgi:hypothetical protein